MQRLLLALCVLLLCAAAYGQKRTLDAFETAEGWRTIASENVGITVSSVPGFDGSCLRIDYDFHGGAGYCIVQKRIPVTLPPNYAFQFMLRGEGPANNLEFKFLDASGDNVWWHMRRALAPPAAWTPFSTRKRHCSFAWGPSGGGPLVSFDKIEFAISASSGGHGTLYLDQLTLERLDTIPPPVKNTEIVGIGWVEGTGIYSILVDSVALHMMHPRGTSEKREFHFDFRARREFGGLVLHWDTAHAPAGFVVERTLDGVHKEEICRVERRFGADDVLYIPECEARTLIIRCLPEKNRDKISLRAVEIKDVEFSDSPNRFFAEVAHRTPRGLYPRSCLGELSYWTVTGARGDDAEALINEEGRVELDKECPSLEPFIRIKDSLYTWSNSALSQELERGYIPMPSVIRDAGGIRLRVMPFAAGETGRSTLVVRYRLRNTSAARRRGSLVLALRPFQVNPPSQFLNTQGGWARVSRLDVGGDTLRVNGNRSLLFLQPPARIGVTSYHNGDAAAYIARGMVPPARHCVDTAGFASAVAEFPFDLSPAGEVEIDVAAPFHPASVVPAAQDIATLYRNEAGAWTEQLNRVQVSIPGADSVYTSVLRSTLGYILVNRDGPGTQPGSRSYERSWIRDGALTSGVLLRLGHAAEVREFLAWYARYQFPSGKIPCVVDRRGADPVPENDSQGEFIHAVYDYVMMTRDMEFLRQMVPHVQRAAAYNDTLRRQRMTAEYRSEEKAEFFGLLPESISHEGYSAKPMHSYWDDFFAARGWADAAALALLAGDTAGARQYEQTGCEFRDAVARSIALSMKKHAVDYIPGCADLGDFDATSTAVAVNIGFSPPFLPAQALQATFDRYYRFFTARKEGREQWDAYTPYEMRVANAMLRLDAADRAHELLAWFLLDRRPVAWNHWAEVVWRDPRAARFIGDMPHTWCGTEYALSVLGWFAYERDSAIVAGAGLKREWIDSERGVSINNLPTRFGSISLAAGRDGTWVRYRLEGAIAVPVILRLIDPVRIEELLVDGAHTAPLPTGELRLRAIPSEIRIRYR